MRDIPILNKALKVQTIGFQHYQGKVIGILITPWMMNLIMLPGEGDDWLGLQVGHKQIHQFPTGSYRFCVNDVDGIGVYQMHSLYSPMREFTTQDQAVVTAQKFIERLFVEEESTDNVVNEELLGKILRGEEIPHVGLEEVDDSHDRQTIDLEQGGEQHKHLGDDQREGRGLTRRQLFRGQF